MTDFLGAVWWLLVSLGILVTIHEFGHFWVARRFGVKVLRFSVGFGNPVFSRYDRHGTEFAVALIPLGGYVKMLDEREAPVPEEQRHEAFTSKPPGQRIAIAAAGPAANFIFAIAAYWLLSVVGFTTVAPITGEIGEGSIADRMGLQSGMEIHQVDGRNVTSWRDIGMRLLERAGEQDEVSFTISDGQGQRTLSTTLNGWQLPNDNPDPLTQFGLSPLRPAVPAEIGQTVVRQLVQTPLDVTSRHPGCSGDAVDSRRANTPQGVENLRRL